MSYRLAKALEVLRDQVNKACPNRDKASDGWIGDPAHRARKSDHNPNKAGVVQALDIDHDPNNGFDSYAFAEHLRSMKDPRIKYVISNYRIFSSEYDTKHKPWVWRKYSGSNPHSMHVHISVRDEVRHYDASVPWSLGTVGSVIPDVPKNVLPNTLRKGAKGEDVRKLQVLLNIEVDGIFGDDTKAAVMSYQRANKLVVDGVVGKYTWTELLKKKETL